MTRAALIDCWPYLAGIVLSVIALACLVRASGARLRLAQLRGLHRDQLGAVQSLSFVLTLPLFVMVILFIVQLSQITIGRLVVEYAAFAACRSAVVWIPANLGDEWENEIGAYVYQGVTVDEENNIFLRYRVEPAGSAKFEKIRTAAAAALMSICPSRDVGAPPAAGSRAVERAYLAMSPAAAGNTRIPARLRNKLAYALASTDLGIEIRHKVLVVPPDPEEIEFTAAGWQDQVIVTVTHDYALLPGPGRLLARRQPRRDGAGNVVAEDRVAQRVENRQGVFVYTLDATLRLNNEGETSVVPYLQSLDSWNTPQAGTYP